MAINWKSWDTVGGVMSIGSTVTGIIGNIAAADKARYEAKSQSQRKAQRGYEGR